GWGEAGKGGMRARDREREWQGRQCMVESAVVLTPGQRDLVEQTIRDHCRIRGWVLHAVNARSNHIHVVVTADRKAEVVRDQFKAWCSRKLSDQVGLTRQVADKAGRRHWWTEGGSMKPIDNDTYLQNAIEYVLERQG